MCNQCLELLEKLEIPVEMVLQTSEKELFALAVE